MNNTCVFCQIVGGALPCHNILETPHHLAFLSIYPNMEGVTLVIPKQHSSSYLFDNSQKQINELMAVARIVSEKLVQAFDRVGRVGVVFEGFGVNHLHIKLYPLHGTAGPWREIPSPIDTYYPTYPGYLSSHCSKRADDKHLAKVAAMIRASKNDKK